ncbi:MAG: DNA repair protein RadA [Rickettsiales bacterium]|jgi:DNA repair protein RadA/Sms|nr:DNA repair protein RadA [Rickettsiales bacterium]
MSIKSVFICQNCGAVHKKWSGKCDECGEWNTITEETGENGLTAQNFDIGKTMQTGNNLDFENLGEDVAREIRFPTGIGELDRALGGGIVRGSAILVGGDPGVGKSTLLLQTSCHLANKNLNCYYISGEESTNQIRLRSRRLQLEKSPLRLVSATNIKDIVKFFLTSQPDAVVIDSIQTIFNPDLSSAAGTVSQVRSCAGELINIAKNRDIILIIVSHVNKDGQIAGPKVLEHMVDTVLHFEGDKDYQFRILRTVKNRFGAANEIGIFEMGDAGLMEISNPSQLFLSSRDDPVSGSAVFGGVEGTRPLLVEIQALLAPSYMPSPRRAVVGWDLNRLAMVSAVLGARCGINLYDKEIYLNVVGGFKIEEPAADLAIAASLISAFKDIAVPKNIVFIGEVGLSGEVRMVSQIDMRIKEAEKLGFKTIIAPDGINKIKTFRKEKFSVEIIPVKHIRDLSFLFKK